MKIARALGIVPTMAALAVAWSPAAIAEDAGWYMGFGAGQSRSKIDDGRIAGGLLADGFTTTSVSNDDSHFGFKVFGGYAFNRYIALESGYFDLGRFGFIANTIPSGALPTPMKSSLLKASPSPVMTHTESSGRAALIPVATAGARP
jgi:OOP family OmpA-OmpF porin